MPSSLHSLLTSQDQAVFASHSLILLQLTVPLLIVYPLPFRAKYNISLYKVNARTGKKPCFLSVDILRGYKAMKRRGEYGESLLCIIGTNLYLYRDHMGSGRS